MQAVNPAVESSIPPTDDRIRGQIHCVRVNLAVRSLIRVPFVLKGTGWVSKSVRCSQHMAYVERKRAYCIRRGFRSGSLINGVELSASTQPWLSACWAGFVSSIEPVMNWVGPLVWDQQRRVTKRNFRLAGKQSLAITRAGSTVVQPSESMLCWSPAQPFSCWNTKSAKINLRPTTSTKS